MISSDLLPTLADHLRAEREEYHRLAALLEREKDALVAAEAEQVAAITAEKPGLYDRLQDFAKRRLACLAADNIAAQPGAMQRWAARHPDQASGVLEEWRQLLLQIRKTRQQNAVNGRLANALVRHFRSRLSLLSGTQGSHATYGPDGNTRVIQFPGSISRL